MASGQRIASVNAILACPNCFAWKCASPIEARSHVHASQSVLGGGNILAFFELPNSPEMGRDPNTPAWVQHIAFKVDSVDALLEAKARLEANGIEVLGPTEHTIFKSIYFRDPNGHRLELAANTATPEMNARLDEVKWEMLDEWSRTKRAPRHAAWMHEKEFATNA